MGRLCEWCHGRLLFPAVVFVLITLCLAGVGCDGSSEEEAPEAQLEEAIIALDDTDYERARQILEGMDPTVEVLRYLSSAYAGLVGIDMLRVLENIDGDGSSGIDAVGGLLGDDGELDKDKIDESLGYINQAVEKIEQIAENLGVAVADLDRDLLVQLGIYSMARTNLTLGDVLIVQVPPLMNPVILTEDALRGVNVPAPPVVNPVQSDTFAKDLVYIDLAIGALPVGNDLKDYFSGFVNDLNSGGGPTVTGAEIQEFITNRI